MVKILLTKKCNDGDPGDLIEYSASSARDMVEQGYGKYYEESKEVEVTSTKKINNEQYKEKTVNKKPVLSFKQEIKNWLMIPKTGIHEATEMLCSEFLSRETVFTIRNDGDSELWIYKEGIYVPEGISYIQEFCHSILDETYNLTVVNKVVEKIKVRTFISQDDFFNSSPKYYIPLKNGLVHVLQNKLYPFSPDMIFFNKLNIEYDPDKKCEKVLEFMKSVLKSKNDVDVIQEWFGFCLLKEYKFEKAMMFIGHGRNGKSKMIELLKNMIGTENCVSVSLQSIEKDNFIKSEFVNKMVNLAGDISGDDLKKTGNFKELTGRDYVTAPRKFKTPIKFNNYAKMLFSANELPKVFDKSKGFWDRWLMIEFPYRFLPEKEIKLLPKHEQKNVMVQDPDIIQKITSPEEMSGLFNWSLEGLYRLLENKDFSLKISSKDITKKWMRKADSFMAFCMDCIQESDTFISDGKIKKSDLVKVYSLYCRYHRSKSIGDKLIKQALQEEYGVIDDRFRDSSGADFQYWDGITFKEGTFITKIGVDGDGFSKPLDFEKNSQIGSIKKTLPNVPKIPLETKVKKDEDFLLESLKRKGLISIGDFITNSSEFLCLNEVAVEMKVEKLKEQRLIYEPKPGFIQVLE